MALRAPLLIPAACFIVGLLCGFAGWAPTWAMALLLPGIIAFFFRRPALGAYIIITAVGWCDASLHLPTPLPQRFINGTHTVSGVVTRVSETMEKGAVSLDVELDSIDSKPCRERKVALTVVSPHTEFSRAQRVAWRGQLEPIRRPPLPQMTDHSGPMRRRGVSATSLVRYPAIISITDEPGLLNDLQRVRRSLQQLLLRSNLDSESTAMLNALLLGDTSWLDTERRTEYSAAGLSHILALSGMHVALLFMLIESLLWPLYITRYWQVADLVIIILLWLYAGITGLSPSVVRAVTMGSVFIIGRLIQRRSVPYNSLCLAALVILVPSPTSLFTYSFQLSFTAVLAIITFADKLNPVSRHDHPRIYAAVAYITVSISAMLGAGVLSTFYFHTFSVYFIVSATVASLLMPCICSSGILVLLLSACGLHSELLCRATEALVYALDATSHGIASWPGATITGIYMSQPELWICLMTVAAFGVWLHQRSRASLRAVAMCVVAWIVAVIIKPEPELRAVEAFDLPYKGEPVTLVRTGSKVTLFTTPYNRDTDLLRHRVSSDFEEYFLQTGVGEVEVRTR